MEDVMSAKAQLREAVEKWERCIGPIRRKYKKEIRAILHQQEIEEERQIFQYEHPDLVREGIVWSGS